METIDMMRLMKLLASLGLGCLWVWLSTLVTRKIAFGENKDETHKIEILTKAHYEERLAERGISTEVYTLFELGESRKDIRFVRLNILLMNGLLFSVLMFSAMD